MAERMSEDAYTKAILSSTSQNPPKNKIDEFNVRAPITAAAVIVWSSASQEAITFRATRTGAKEVHRQRHAGMRGDEPPNPITPTDRVQFSQPPPAGFDSW
ncbi:predicted protein [Histoplasma capsulatum var. duboisii H88]|uniref:Predicted protein n=1 Tax=Ajellomyces capsulatus (strain H88) TaxID=544711 RepID=F0UHV0_AJEC8|nr:predicted protein [Histoplasma capsulatum var. duboisii H88]